MSLTRPANPAVYQIDDRNTLMKLMHDIAWRTFHRTYAIACSDLRAGYQLYFNAEMLVGGADTTQHTEIERIFERMEIKHDPDRYHKALPDEIAAYVDSINEDMTIPIDRSGETRLRAIKYEGVTTLVFEFGGTQVHRTQHVTPHVCDGRCIFMSKATGEGFCKKLSVRDVIRYTWIRNRHIDLVEFVVDPNFAIIGHVVHPVENMQWEEFIYCAYTLAVETDNLEYLLNKIDLY